MKQLRFISAIVVAIAYSALARADLVPAPWTQADAAPATAVEAQHGPRAVASVPRAFHDADWLGTDLPIALAPAGLCNSATVARQAPVLELPPAPDSAVLCLSALAGLGVWHLGRSARKLHFGAVPEWYHSSGPAQVGHTTPLDPEFSLAALPLCRFESPDTDEPPPPSWLRLVEPIGQQYCQYSLSVTAPRGPPLVSF